MAGLVAAARLRELGVDAAVVEKGTRVGGSMLISSGVVWRHREWGDFRTECPRGDEDLQALVWDRLDEALDWLVALGAEPVAEETGNPRTTGKRFDPRALTAALARRADVRLRTSLAPENEPPVILATGGFGRRLSKERRLLLRANPWSAGDALDWALSRGAMATSGMGEFYGRAMPARPARIREEDFVPLAQLYGREARVLTDDGKDITPPSVAWHENDLVQLIGPSAWYVVEQTNDRIEAARAAGGTVNVRNDGRLAVHVSAAVTHTIGGLRVDRNARVVGLDGVWAAGADAGGIATGGYSSGLAQALVLGLAAAEDAAGLGG
jgi:succinate dehydrogenase/fumarate reductase flavoprotein subunit